MTGRSGAINRRGSLPPHIVVNRETWLLPLFRLVPLLFPYRCMNLEHLQPITLIDEILTYLPLCGAMIDYVREKPQEMDMPTICRVPARGPYHRPYRT